MRAIFKKNCFSVHFLTIFQILHFARARILPSLPAEWLKAKRCKAWRCAHDLHPLCTQLPELYFLTQKSGFAIFQEDR